MRSFSIVLAIASNFAAIAASAPTNAAFNVANLLVSSFESYSPSNATGASTYAYIKFDIYDPDPVTNSTSQCGAQWNPRNGTAPTSYVRFPPFYPQNFSRS
jgi:hypothetical protein